MRVICKNCGCQFDTADRVSSTAIRGAEVQVRYCSERCKRQAQNKRYYKRHRRSIIDRVLRRQHDS